MLIGYARVSTDDQNFALQTQALNEMGGLYLSTSKNIMPELCTDFSTIDSKYAHELWVYDLQNMKKEFL